MCSIPLLSQRWSHSWCPCEELLSYLYFLILTSLMCTLWNTWALYCACMWKGNACHQNYGLPSFEQWEVHCAYPNCASFSYLMYTFLHVREGKISRWLAALGEWLVNLSWEELVFVKTYSITHSRALREPDRYKTHTSEWTEIVPRLGVAQAWSAWRICRARLISWMVNNSCVDLFSCQPIFSLTSGHVDYIFFFFWNLHSNPVCVWIGKRSIYR